MFYSCFSCLDSEEFKDYSLNSEYKISYAKNKNRKTNGILLLTQEKESITVVDRLVYNNSNIYFKSLKTLNGLDFYYQLKIDLKSEKIGDRKMLHISKEEFDAFASKCKDCIILDMETLDKMDEDIPPLPPSDEPVHSKQKQFLNWNCSYE